VLSVNNNAASSSIVQATQSNAIGFHHPTLNTRHSMISIIKEGLDSLPVAMLIQITAEVVPKPEEQRNIIQHVPDLSHAAVVTMNPNDMHIGGDAEEAACDQLMDLPVTPIRHITVAAIRPAFYNTASSVAKALYRAANSPP
jgi:hypothetical protein